LYRTVQTSVATDVDDGGDRRTSTQGELVGATGGSGSRGVVDATVPDERDAIRARVRDLSGRWALLPRGETLELEFDRARFTQTV